MNDSKEPALITSSWSIDAFEKVVSLYGNQKKRKGWDKPYIAQHFAIFIILTKLQERPEVCLAGFYHSALNDLPRYTYRQLVADIGTEAARLVKEVSELNAPGGIRDKKANWQKRKDDILGRFSLMSPLAQKIFAVANVYYLKSLIDAYYEKGDMIWDELNAPKERMGWYYKSLGLLFTTYFRHPLVADYHHYSLVAENLFRW